MSDAGGPEGATIVCTVTGHGLKDPQWALRSADGGDVTRSGYRWTSCRLPQRSAWVSRP